MITAGSGLTTILVAGGLIAASILVIGLLLVLAGFLSAPLLLTIALVAAGLIVLGLSITAAILSRRRIDRP